MTIRTAFVSFAGRARFVAVVCAVAVAGAMLLTALPALAADGARQVVQLRSGNRLEGDVIKRTADTLFLDVGPTIIALPVAAVEAVEDLGKAEVDPAASTRPDRTDGATNVRHESVFSTAQLERGSIRDKARAVASSVVKVSCLGKSGSGFIVNAERGFVVTNFHVVEGEQDISIVLYVKDDAEEPGAEPSESGARASGASIANGGFRKVTLSKIKIVSLNSAFDLALLEIVERDGVELHSAYLGDYERVRVGDPVFAIGSPLGLERTVSEGIVSNRNRFLRNHLFIQTTTAINPGNSGGPLFNDRGEVVGVTSLKVTSGESLGFAIPVHYVKDFLRNREAYAFDKDNPNTGIRYLAPPPKRPAVVPSDAAEGPEGTAGAGVAAAADGG